MSVPVLYLFSIRYSVSRIRAVEAALTVAVNEEVILRSGVITLGYGERNEGLNIH